MSVLHKRTLWKANRASGVAAATRKKTVRDLDKIPAVIFSDKTAEALAAAGHDDASVLRGMTDDEILAIKGIGPSRLREIRAQQAEG